MRINVAVGVRLARGESDISVGVAIVRQVPSDAFMQLKLWLRLADPRPAFFYARLNNFLR